MQWLPEDPILRFVLRLMLWLLPCFAVWYLLANILLTPAALIVEWILQLLMPQSFRGMDLDGHSIQFDTRLVMHTEDGRLGSPMFALNPLSYAWNLPVLAALLLAGTEQRLPRRLLLGYFLLLPAWAWGLCSQFAKTLAFDLGPEVAAQLGRPGIWLDLLALAYQFGVLILPAISLVLVWPLLARNDLLTLTGIKRSHTERPPDPPATRQRHHARRTMRKSKRLRPRR